MDLKQNIPLWSLLHIHFNGSYSFLPDISFKDVHSFPRIKTSRCCCCCSNSHDSLKLGFRCTNRLVVRIFRQIFPRLVSFPNSSMYSSWLAIFMEVTQLLDTPPGLIEYTMNLILSYRNKWHSYREW